MASEILHFPYHSLCTRGFVREIDIHTTKMEIKEFRDDDGSVTKLKQYKDQYFPIPFIGDEASHIDAISNMQIRDDDVMVATYPKSGTHWVVEIIWMLRAGHAKYTSDTMPNIEFMDTNTVSSYPSPRVLQAHLPFKFLPRSIKQRGKIIYVTRNPKDTAVSFYNMCHKMNDFWSIFNGTFESFLDKMFYTGKFPYGSWFDYVLDWEEVIKNESRGCSILHIQYEDMKKNLRASVEQIAQFLQIKCEDDLLDEIATKCSFQNMKPGKEKIQGPMWKFCTKDGNMPIFRKGEIGDWRNWFTTEQNERFDKEFAKRMKNSRLTFQFDP